MKSSRTWWQRLLLSRWVVPVAVVSVAVPFGLASRDDGRTSITAVVAAVLVGLLAVWVVLGLGLTLAGFDSDAPAIAERLAADPDQQRLLARWLRRARWARFVGGLCGVIVWMFGTQTHGDLFILGMGGIAAGALIAESHHMRRPRGARTARLDVRSVGTYLMQGDARRMMAVTVGAIVAAAIGAFSVETRSAVWWGCGAMIVMGVARLAQLRVAGRARPAVSEKLTQADDLVRVLAIGRGLARPATYLAMAMVAQAAYALEPSIGWIGAATGFVGRVYALHLWWWYNRRLGLDFLIASPNPPLLA